MYKYAQILYGKAHSIFEHEHPLEVLVKEYFAPNIILVDITNQPNVQEGWDYDGFTFIAPVIPVVLFTTLQENKWLVIRASRDAELRTPLLYMGKLLDFDKDSSERLTYATNAAIVLKSVGQVFSTVWTTHDGSPLVMTGDDLMGIPVAVAARANILFIKGRTLSDEIMAATTQADLDLVVW